MLDKGVPCCVFRRSRTSESFQLLHVEYIRRPRVKTVVVSLPLYKSIPSCHSSYGFSTPFLSCTHRLLSKSFAIPLRKMCPLSSLHSNLQARKLLGRSKDEHL